MNVRSDLPQLALIALLAISVGLFGVFFLREVYPQYKVFQETYEKLEEFRSTITGEAPAPFKIGVKQIVLVQERNGPEVIDRCTSCHVALELAHFSPTKIALDVNGNVMLDAEGVPVKVPNENYVWRQVDDKIAELSDSQVLVQLEATGKAREAADRVDQAGRLTALKMVEVDGRIIDMTKVLAMHPLMGKETRPFEFHSLDDFGCTSCHNGNGRGLTMEKAHGPVFDGEYEEAFEGPRPEFLEVDPLNDPKFSKVFNHKPGHALLFQTTPIFPGPLLQANCVQCHMTAGSRLQGAVSTIQGLKDKADVRVRTLEAGFVQDKQAALALLGLEKELSSKGYFETANMLRKRQQDFALPEKERAAATAQLLFLEHNRKEHSVEAVNEQLVSLFGSEDLVQELRAQAISEQNLDAFLAKHASAPGVIFEKAGILDDKRKRAAQLDRADQSLANNLEKNAVANAVSSSVDAMTQCYQRGAQLYVSQACYACHRIAGMARGGVGPELTLEGNSYPWFVKESIVWPQADLRTSTMPNYKLDHSELEALTCFLLAQKGRPRYVSPVDYQVAIRQWEEGKKPPLEQPVEPSKIQDLHFGMTVFATEGCAACHRLKGFESNVGYAIQKNATPTFDELYKVRSWFTQLIPEQIAGSEIVQAIETHQDEIDRNIIADVRKGSLLEEIEEKFPNAIEALYSNFQHALRAKDNLHNAETASWKERVRRVLMMYVQEYGLGRQIGPRPNWSGIYRSDEWLLEHFYNPSSHVARSIMPVFPFDETKFYALTYMLDILGRRNTEAIRQVWAHRGFNPEVAYDAHCSQCHGSSLQGNGPVSEWIYPIPKSLRNATFLRNLTRERVKESIIHGVKGGPMPPWGELGSGKPFKNDMPVLTPEEADKLVDWLFAGLPDDSSGSQEPLKWKYEPEDVLHELEQEGDKLESRAESESNEIYSLLPQVSGLLASTKPMPVVSSKVDEVFDIRPYPVADVDRQAYYIKDKYYTPHNLDAGKALFVESCSICHGKEGAGTGLRAGAMVEAKPRMLTNLDWISTRDDLRLLQSIKYGVPGTAMTPWGDYTSTLQRLQLVMYIRSLSHEHVLRERLSESLYQAFDVAVETIRQAEIVQYSRLQEIKKSYHDAEETEDALDAAIAQGKGNTNEAATAYQKRIEVGNQLRAQQEIDQSFQKLISEVKDQRTLYLNLCVSLLARLGDIGIADQAVAMIKTNAVQYEVTEGKLSIFAGTSPDKVVASGLALAKEFDTPLADLEKEKSTVSGKISSGGQQERLQELTRRIASYKDAKTQLIAAVEEAARSVKRQKELVEQINVQIDALTPQNPPRKT